MAPHVELASAIAPEYVGPRGRGGLWQALVDADGAHRTGIDEPAGVIDLDLVTGAHLEYLGRVDPTGSFPAVSLAAAGQDAVVIDLTAERARRRCAN